LTRRLYRAGLGSWTRRLTRKLAAALIPRVEQIVFLVGVKRHPQGVVIIVPAQILIDEEVGVPLPYYPHRNGMLDARRRVGGRLAREGVIARSDQGPRVVPVILFVLAQDAFVGDVAVRLVRELFALIYGRKYLHPVAGSVICPRLVVRGWAAADW